MVDKWRVGTQVPACLIAVLAVGVAACGGGDGPSTSQPMPATEAAAPERTVEPTAVPTVVVPTAAPERAPEPTATPTAAPEGAAEPTLEPTPVEPTAAPEVTAEPTVAPTPSATPTVEPTSAATAGESTLGAPPPELGFSAFYGKYLDAGSLPIIASAQVPDEALVQVKRLVEEMVGNRDDILAKFREYNVRVAVMVEASGVTELPELSDLYEVFPGTDWDERIRGGGVGPTFARPVVAIAEEHLLCHDTDLFRFEDIFVHEFAHGVLNMGVELLPGGTEFRERLESAYHSAMDAGLWAATYAATNADEYWAEGVQSWFDLNDPPGPIHNEINTRAELEDYDPVLAGLIGEVFGEAAVSSSCHPKGAASSQ